jgi:hypothetical protein
MTTLRCLFSLLVLTICTSLVLPAAQAQILSFQNFKSVTVDGSTHTEVNGIGGPTDGIIVGFYVDSNGVEHGFETVAGKITPIDVPGSTGTRAYGVDLNDFYVVGTYTDSKLVVHGFELRPSGKFATIDVPHAVWTRAFSVNSAGTIAGAYADQAGIVHGFLDNNGKGKFTKLDFPKAVVTEITDIVNLRYMSGIFVDSSGAEHGVVGGAGELGAAINVPGAGLTAANGVNDAVEIAGYYGASSAGPFHGYFFGADQFLTIDFPDATDTRCNGISDSLDIVGRYTDSNGVVHGFTAQGVYTSGQQPLSQP